MMRKHSFLGFGIVAFWLAMIFITGCASVVRPLNESAMSTYGIFDDFEQLKIYQYFVSRDIVLTAVATNVETSVSGGQAFSSRSTHRDVINLLASTAGRCLEYDTNGETYIRLGIEFDQGSKDLLWFYFDNDDEYFYLEHTGKSEGEVEYAGKTYKVTYEEAEGIGATFQRLTTTGKSKEEYLTMKPMLLFEENIKQKETESKRTLGGSKL